MHRAKLVEEQLIAAQMSQPNKADKEPLVEDAREHVAVETTAEVLFG